jgi:hypothetical protein
VELQNSDRRATRFSSAPSESGPLRRFCSGCSRETEHGAWGGGGRATIPTIRWPGPGPAVGTTICLDCGQWRAVASRPVPPASSTWSKHALPLQT